MRPALLLCLVLPHSALAQAGDERQATLKFLAALQQPDGGFVPAPAAKPGKSSLRATSAAIRAMKYLGGEVPNADKVRAFVTACHDPESGAFADAPGGKGDGTATAVGLMAVAELQKSPPRDRALTFLAKSAKTFDERRLAVAGMEAAGRFDPVIQDRFVEVRRSANPDGTYGTGDGQARETGGVVAMFLRSGEKLPDDQRKAVVAALEAGQRPDGGFGKAGESQSDGETTYRVMRAFHLLKQKPKDVAGLRGFVAKCRNSDGGYGVGRGQPSTVSGTYFAAVIEKWLAE